ncbi:hypothetical protein GCM10007855_08540 [Aliivibrio sifiae]|uniref:Uncharacterized protein n=1 Tax=Aliivibrio sifiae TaxID=566293 RepID=A0ABQ6AES0_9GAMM|nr:hypothetical protein GCM10007855_08540 [Aliivibrio sifiae]
MLYCDIKPTKIYLGGDNVVTIHYRQLWEYTTALIDRKDINASIIIKNCDSVSNLHI